MIAALVRAPFFSSESASIPTFFHFAGKSDLVQVLAGNDFQGNLPPTVFDTVKSSIEIGRSWKSIPLEFWDVSGNDRYAKKRPVIYPNVSVFAVWYAVTIAHHVVTLSSHTFSP